MARIANNFDIQLVDASGNALSSGTIQFYEAGTSTPKNTYPTRTDAQNTTNANPNPITCDSQGRPNNSGLIDIWLLTDTAYKVVIKDSTGSTVRTIDNYSGTFDPDLGDYTSKNIKFADNDGIQDSNGNEVIDVVKSGNAVNFFQAKNASTGNDVELAAAGTDSNIGINLNPKGTGLVTINGAFGFPNTDGTNSQYLTTNGSGTLSWTSLSIATPLPQGYISGCFCETQADADHDIRIQTGVCRDESDTYNIDHSSNITKQIDAVWSAGNNAGGRASAVSLSANLTLHYFLIVKADGTRDAGFDTALGAGNLLTDATDYVGYRRIMSFRLDGSSNIRPFIFQDAGTGYHMIYTDPTLDISTNSLTTTRTSFGMQSVPQGLNLRVTGNALLFKSGSTPLAYVANDDVDNEVPATGTAPLISIRAMSSSIEQPGQLSVWTNTSAQITARSSENSTIFRFAPTEFYDPRNT